MEKEFVTYEQALALNELGFDEECCGGYKKSFPYDNEWKFYIDDIYCQIQAPLKQQVFRWFDKKYNLFGYIERFQGGRYEDVISGNFMEEYDDGILFDTIEEAENNCINRLIELAKQQDNGK